MRAFVSLAALPFLFPVVLGQYNITVIDTDPSIQYRGGAGDAPICKVSSDGTIVSSQPGCYNIPSKCTASVAMGQRQASAATFTFQGSAIYINSLLFNLSPLYTVTLDGNATDVDGFSASNMFLCEMLFSRTGLDPTVNHAIALAIKSQSPNATRPPTLPDDVFDFSLINFIYTVEGAGNSSSTSTPASTASTTSTSSVLASTSGTASSNALALANTTKSSSSISMQAVVSGLHAMGLAVRLVVNIAISAYVYRSYAGAGIRAALRSAFRLIVLRLQ
ncbi:hypothetical protein BJ912DRAFT_1047015 [Pholiota molesta]|nr:hypothetical protein BJ912DRAFT_1047015 [Pholiota molesta]